jgi:hypothetical protein
MRNCRDCGGCIDWGDFASCIEKSQKSHWRPIGTLLIQDEIEIELSEIT